MTSIVCEAWKRKELVLWLVKCKIVVCELMIRPVWWPTTHVSQQNQKPHGRNKNITAKPKTSRQKQNTSRQNQNPHGKNKIPYGKTKTLTVKTKYLTAKPKTSWQNQILRSKSKIALVLLWVIFAFAVRNLVFAVKYLVLPWGLWFRREVFGFVMRYIFVFAVRFLVLLWQLWATVDPPLPPPARYLEESNFQNRSTVLYVINFTFHLLLAYIVLWYRKIKNWRKTLNNKKNIPW